MSPALRSRCADETPAPSGSDGCLRCLPPSSKLRQYLSVALAGLAVFSMGGLCFGFDSMYPILYSSGAFVHYCSAEEEASCAARPLELRDSKCCEKQLSAFVTLTSVSLFGADGVMVLYGELVDRAGPRWCMSVALALAWLGIGLISFNASLMKNQIDMLWLLAFPLLGISGPGIFMAVLSFGEVYPRLEPIITPLAASMFDGSAFVFLFWKLLFQLGGFSLAFIAALWLAVSLVVGAFTWSLLLSHRQTEAMREEHKQHEKSAELQPTVEDAPPTIETVQAHPWYSDRDGLFDLFLRTDTVLLLAFMCLANLNQSFYIETFADQARQMLPEEQADEIVEVFDVVFPFLSVATTPLAIFLVNRSADFPHIAMSPGESMGGWVSMHDLNPPCPLVFVGHGHSRFSCRRQSPLQNSSEISLKRIWSPARRYNHREYVYLAVVVGLSCLFGITQIFPMRNAQYLAAIMFGPARTLQWACYFHYLATPSRYPSATIGRMVGYANLLIAIVGDGPPYALAAFIQRGSFPSTESERYVFVHAGLMMGVVALSIALPGHLWWAARVRTQRLRFSTLRALHIASHMDPSRSKASSTRSFEMELGMAAVADEELPGSTASAGTERGEKVKLHVTCEGSDEVGFSDGFHDDGHRLTTRLP